MRDDRNQPSRPWLAVIDGGGTGLRLRLHGPDGAAKARVGGGPASLTHGVAQARRNAAAALSQALAEAGCDPAAPPPLRVAAALAGARSASNRAAFLAGPPFDGDVTLMSDGYAALIGGLGGRPGSAISVGTGVIGQRLTADGRVVGVSGWGFPVGDEGGGAWIGLTAARAFTRWIDGRGGASPTLFAALSRQLGAGTEEIQAWLIAAGAREFAGLAPLVAASAEAGDALAGSILDSAAAEIAMTLAALEREAPSEAVVLLGGLAAVLTPRLPADMRDRLSPPAGDALDGAFAALTGQAPRERLLGEAAGEARDGASTVGRP